LYKQDLKEKRKWQHDKTVTNWTGNARKWSWPNLRYYPDIYLDGLKKITNETLFTMEGVLTEVTAYTTSA